MTAFAHTSESDCRTRTTSEHYTANESWTRTKYGYDNIYELLNATQGASTTENYTYDPVGNRLSNLSGSGWSNNTSNELTSRPGATYTYDNNGNTLTKADSTGTTNYTWDFENRLTSVALPGSGGTVTFKYDPLGRRIYKSSSLGTSIYAYDGDNLVEETNASGGVVARYSQGLNIDEPLAMLRSATTSYYQADGLGSVTSLTNAAGTAAQNYTYDSFGNIIAATGSLTNSFRYTGREFDSESNLYFYRARYYDPAAGRFLSEDPINFRAGINFYPYVRNNPNRFVDPLGMALTSVDAAMEQAIARGNLAEVEALLDTTGNSLTPGMRQAAQLAIDNGSTTVGGDNSAAELARHLKNVSEAEDEVAELQEWLKNAPQKARGAIRDAITRLLKDIKGHIKEISQRWGCNLK